MKRKLNEIVFFASNEGGHFSQMIALKQLFEKYQTVIVTDNVRADKSMPALKNVLDVKYAMAFANRRKELMSQEENLTRWSYSVAYVRLFKECLAIWKEYRPAVIISTGSNIAVPFCIISKLFGSKFVYIESRARVYSKSVAGKIVERMADKVIVQWPEMISVYGGKAEYYGTLV